MSDAKTTRRGFFEWLTGCPARAPEERSTEDPSFSIEAFYRERAHEAHEPFPRFEVRAAPVPTTRVGVPEYGEASIHEPPAIELPDEVRRLADAPAPDESRGRTRPRRG